MSTVAGSVRDATAASDLSHINEEIYKKNSELAEKNKVLSLLRKIDEITLSTITDPQHISDQVAKFILQEIGFRGVGIFLLHKTELKNIAMELSGTVLEYERLLLKIFQEQSVSLIDHKENLLVRVVNERKKKVTKYLFDVFHPMTDLNTASAIQGNIHVRTSVVLPLLVREQTLGAIIFFLSEDEELISGLKADVMDRLSEVIGISLDNAMLYREIQEANVKLQQLDKLKDEFVSIASHELRTPMTIIRSYLWMLMQAQNGLLNQKQKLYLDRAYGSTVRLIHLINDMLDTSRIESGRMSMNLESVDLHSLAADIVNEIVTRATQLGIAISVENRATPPVRADKEKIREVLINLIGNSLKFTPHGGYINIAFEVGEDTVLTKVVDSGAGFTPQVQAGLFQKFGFIKTAYQTNKSESEGTGLGLYISKSIIDMHQGSIQASSPGPGKGSTFSFMLRRIHEQ